MDVREKYVMQKVNRKEKSICPNCIHHNLCIAENNQPCFECNRFIDAHGVTVQEWISVNDRLPVDSTTVNLYTRSRTVGTGFYDKHTKSWVQYYSGGAICVDVTHWQPMPQPPKGE